MDNHPAKIVYIEDEIEMIQLVKIILTKHGFELYGVVNRLDGFDRVVEIMPDLILLEMAMSPIDGWEVYRKLKGADQTRTIPIIIITARESAIDRIQAEKMGGVDDYITKPFGAKDLISRINNLLNKDR